MAHFSQVAIWQLKIGPLGFFNSNLALDCDGINFSKLLPIGWLEHTSKTISLSIERVMKVRLKFKKKCTKSRLNVLKVRLMEPLINGTSSNIEFGMGCAVNTKKQLFVCL